MSQPPLPAVQARAAVRAGRLAAAGLLHPVRDAPQVQAAIAAAARRAASGQDPRGLAIRLAHRFADARDAALADRARARAAIAAALAPLLARRAPGAEIVAAAHAADPAGALDPAERLAEAEALLIARLHRMRR